MFHHRFGMVGSILVALVVCSQVAMAATLTKMAFKPAGDSPYEWGLLSNWQMDDGTPALALPGSEDNATFDSGMAGKTVVIGTDVVALVGGLSVAGEGMNLVVDDGGMLYFAHSNNYFGNEVDNCVLRVRSGGSLSLNNFFRLGFSGTKNKVVRGNRIVNEEGGSFSCGGNDFYLAHIRYQGDAAFENHGEAVFNGNVYVGYTDKTGTDAVTGVIDNYATLSTKSSSSLSVYLGSQPGMTGIFTNHVGATATMAMGLSVGASSNAVGIVVNEGDFTLTRPLFVGGNGSTCSNSTASKFPQGFFFNRAGATTTLSGEIRLGGWQYGKAVVENSGEMNLDCAYTRMAYSADTVAAVTNTATGKMTFGASNQLQIGYNGEATLSSSGTVIVNSTTAPLVGRYANSVGRLVLEGGAFTGNGKGLDVGNQTDGATGFVELKNDAKMFKVGDIRMGLGRYSKASFTMAGDSVLDAPGTLNIGIGRKDATTQTWTQMASFVLKDNACVTNMNNTIYVVSNVYGKGVLELAGNSRIVFSNARPRSFYIGSALANSANSQAELRLRGGVLVLTTNCTVHVGNSSTSGTSCRGSIAGWGRIERHCLESNGSSYGSTLSIHGGRITADGDGVERDLDVSTFRKVNSSANGTNASGTNGWYAINRGRLTYPCRNGSYRMLGDYYSRSGDPVYMNGVAFTFDSTKSGYLIGQLYATDRDDIPAGLPADDAAAKTLRLGVWRATVNKNFELNEVSKANAGTIASAAVRIRYDNYRLNALKDAEGNLPDGLRVTVYRHDGTPSGTWVKAGSAMALAAEADNHVVGGDLVKSEGDWNLGFFAVVAEPKKGTNIIIR